MAKTPLPEILLAEWLHEAGIGEARAALVADGTILEALVEREADGPRVGAVLPARLVHILAETNRGRQVWFVSVGDGIFDTCAMPDVVLGSASARRSRQISWENGMTWKAPKIVEVPVGMEINMYACAARK